MKNNILNIVDENGNVIGEETREKIHEQGLLHKEIHVWFYTPKKEIIFQHRDKNKDTFPNLLDATVGGHVEKGEDYINTAIKETKEETGIDLILENLRLVKIRRSCSKDSVTGKINNVLRAIYFYEFTGDLKDLKIENKEAIGFETWLLNKLESLNEEDKKKFIPNIVSGYLDIFKEVLE
ncbi:MAG: NUDIX domain-containing protein [Patescibacteria group bacterium]|jgi:isopentenyldiphosphate isomerase